MHTTSPTAPAAASYSARLPLVERYPAHPPPVLDSRHRAPARTRIRTRPCAARQRPRSRCRARELVDEPPEGVRALAELAAREAVDVRRQAHGDVRVLEVRERELELHFLDLRVPVSPRGTCGSDDGACAWEGEGTRLEVKREKSSARTFCVESFDAMSLPASCSSSALPYCVLGFQEQLEFCRHGD